MGQAPQSSKTFVAKFKEDKNGNSFKVSSEPAEITGKDLSQSVTKRKIKEGRGQRYLKKLALLLVAVVGEFIGTFILTLAICTVVTTSVVTGAQVGLWQVAVVCGLGVSIAIYTTAHLSDAHLNPAITLAFALVRWKSFSWKRIVPYVISQMLGGVMAGAVLYALYGDAIALFEEKYDIDRGSNDSTLTAMLFGEYFPNPALYNHSLPSSYDVISPVEAMLVEAFCTSVLAFVIFSLTDKQNCTVGTESNKVLVPLVIGITVAVMISICAPLTQVGMNPARDFGPRIFAAFAGWGSIAIPGPRYGFWTYIVGPIIGAILGAILNDWLLSYVLHLSKTQDKEKQTNTVTESEQG